MRRHVLDKLDEDLIEMTFVFAYENMEKDLTGDIPFEDWKMAIDDWPVEFECETEGVDWGEEDYSKRIEDFTKRKIDEMLEEYD